MKYVKLSENQWFLRLEKDEELAQSVRSFCEEKTINAGYIQGIGGLQTARIGIYRLSGSKEYEFQDFSGDLELIILQGNIARSDERIVLHMHAVIGNEQLHTVGGHFDSGIAGGTVELYITEFDVKFERVLDSDIGLKLLNFPA